MRYDKRGTGESDGEVPDLSTANSVTIIDILASDMRSVLDQLLSDPRTDPDQVGLFGASQANWYMPVVADQRDEVDFMVVVTGGVIPTGMQNTYEELTRLQGRSQEEAEATLGLLEDFTGDVGFTQIPILERLKIPMLYLLGDEDPALPRNSNIAAMQNLAASGVDLEFIVYPRGAHLLPGVDFWPDFTEWLERKLK
jgi:dienelactone hydrolase